jgi:phosphatidylserine decarboxylase
MPFAAASVPYLLVTGGLTAAFLLAWRATCHPAFVALSCVSGILCLAFLWFFRDPEREIPRDANLILAPGDGTVRKIHQGKSTRTIEIFLAVTNVHVQRAPVSGKVLSVAFTKGEYLMAFDDKAGTRNTRCETWFATKEGKVGMTQVAGWIARKVECWLTPGQTVTRGARMGIIHMGSQVRVELPKRAKIMVKPGDPVTGGVTAIAKWR